MSYDYLDILFETEKVSKILGKVIKDYIAENRLPCNITQIIVLHLLMKIDGNASPSEVHDKTKYMYSNNHNSFASLTKNGYLTQKNGKDIELDGRCVFLFVTKKGEKLYKDICDVLNKKMTSMREYLQWEDNDFENYFSDLYALQEFI